MSKDELLTQLEAQIAAAQEDARQAQAKARDAELRAAFLQGQRAMLLQLDVQPTMTYGSEEPHA